MSSEPLSEGIVAAHDRLVTEAVKAEREKCQKAVADAISDIHAKRDPAMRVWRALEACRDALEESRTEPPAPEPMTVATMIAKLAAVSNKNWNTIRGDLQELVREQARLDAAVCEALAIVAQGKSTHRAVNEMKTLHYMNCHDAILRAAGLE